MLRVTTRKRVAMNTARSPNVKRPAESADLRATSVHVPNGNVDCSSATVIPPTPPPSTRPAGITVSLQLTIGRFSASVTPPGARRVVKDALPERVVPAAFVATTRQ